MIWMIILVISFRDSVGSLGSEHPVYDSPYFMYVIVILPNIFMAFSIL